MYRYLPLQFLGEILSLFLCFVFPKCFNIHLTLVSNSVIHVFTVPGEQSHKENSEAQLPFTSSNLSRPGCGVTCRLGLN